MGFIADLRAVSDIQKIKSGGTAKLSISQITGLIINLADAKRNLESSKYNKICELFDKLRKCNTKTEMTYQTYLLYAVDVIKRFDAIAPYEKYSGGNETELSFLMDEIRGNVEQQAKNDTDCNSTEADAYATSLAPHSNGLADIEDAKQFTKILISYPALGKEKVLNDFDDFVDAIVKKYGPLQALPVGSFFMGALNANEIISNKELENMTYSFRQAILNTLSADK